MASPKKIEIAYSFLDHTVNEPDVPQPGDKLDEAFSEVKRASDETIDRLNLIQRDDGQLARVVGTDQFTEPFLDQFTALKTGAENAATSAAQSAASALADKNDAAQILTDTRAVRDEVNQTASTFDATFSQALTDLDAAKTSAVGAVNTSKTEGVAAVDGAKTGALTEIGTARTGALSAINSAGTGAVNAVNDARDTTLADITAARTAGVGAVNTSAAAGVNAVETAQTVAVTAVTTAKNDGVSAVTTAKDNAVTTIGLHKTDAVSEVEGAAISGRNQINADKDAALTQINNAKNTATTEIAGQVVVAQNAAQSAAESATEAATIVGNLGGGTTGQFLVKKSNNAYDYAWENITGGGDMLAATYDPTGKAADVFSMGNMAETTTAKIMTAAERTKLAGIAAGATANTGTVTSVGVSVPAGFSASAAITTSGTISITYATGYQGYTSAEATKLAGIAAGADKTPGVATTTANGLMSSGDKSKLNGVAANATANTGTVTSVGVSVPSGFSVSGAITTSGTISITYASGYQGYTTDEANKLASIDAGAQANTVYSVNTKTGYVQLNADDVGAASVAQGLLAEEAVSFMQTQSLSDTDKARARNNIGASSFGAGQTWQDVTASRTDVTDYVNNTGKPIVVKILVTVYGYGVANINVSNVTGDMLMLRMDGELMAALTVLVPNLQSYKLSLSDAAIVSWLEYR